MRETAWPPQRADALPSDEPMWRRQRRLRTGGVAVAVMALASAGWWSMRVGTRATEPSQPTLRSPVASVVPKQATVSDKVVAGDAVRSPAAAVERLWTTGSLRGTELDGDWGAWTGDILLPRMALRRRFDQLLSGQDEVGLPALRAWVAEQVRAIHGDAGAVQVLAVWDRYLQLQQTAFAQRLDVADPSTWQPALAEHSRVRRQLLGSAWAEAFYGEEERSFAAMASARVARSQPGALPAAPDDNDDRTLRPANGDMTAERLQAARVAAFGRDAAERLQAGDADWAAWQRRVAEAKSAWSALATAPELSDAQRAEAQERLLVERFSDDERIRARALVTPASSG